jgi:hypothetical protein
VGFDPQSSQNADSAGLSSAHLRAVRAGRVLASIATLPKGRPRGAVFHLPYACATAIFLIGLIKSRPQN